MKIEVQHKDYGFFSEEPITVQVKEKIDGDEFDTVWCNHAGAELEDQYNEIVNPNGRDITWTTKVWICDKCDAYRFDEEDQWEDAPFGGVR